MGYNFVNDPSSSPPPEEGSATSQQIHNIQFQEIYKQHVKSVSVKTQHG
jgi:hypothetical protein